MEKKKILVVEDDKNISKLVKYNLEKEGFITEAVFDGEEALDCLYEKKFDLVILDLMLPEVDGLTICKEIKQDRDLSYLPIIIVTAKGEEVDRIVGFELGADDYVVKPFSPRELILRVKSVLKRNKQQDSSQSIMKVGKLFIDVDRHKVMVEKKEIILTHMEFNLLVTLIKRRGRVQSRDDLLEDVWDMSADVTTRTVDTHIKRIRKKLGRCSKMIETIRGVGYRFSEED